MEHGNGGQATFNCADAAELAIAPLCDVAGQMYEHPDGCGAVGLNAELERRDARTFPAESRSVSVPTSPPLATSWDGRSQGDPAVEPGAMASPAPPAATPTRLVRTPAPAAAATTAVGVPSALPTTSDEMALSGWDRVDAAQITAGGADHPGRRYFHLQTLRR